MQQPFETNPPERNEPVVAQRALTWFKCSAQITDNSGVPRNDICKANLWNGVDQGKTDYVVYTFSPKSVSDTFYATRPEGGTNTSYTDNKNNTYKVVWMESPIGVTVQTAKAKDNWHPGDEVIEAYQTAPGGSLPPLPPGQTERPTILLRVCGNVSRATWYANIFQNDLLQYIPTQGDTHGSQSVFGTLLWTGIAGGDIRSLFQITGTNAAGFDMLRSHNLT